MGALVNFNTATKRIEVTAAPVLGVVSLNVQTDIYSDGVLDWEASQAKRGHTFPIVPVGGQSTPRGKLGTTYFVRDPWVIEPLEQNHTLEISGNVFAEGGGDLVADSVGAFNVRVRFFLSTLVEVVESVSAADVNTKLDQILDVSYGQKELQDSADPIAGVPGYLILYDDSPSPVLLGHKELWEDQGQTVGYRGAGIGFEGPLTAGPPP